MRETTIFYSLWVVHKLMGTLCLWTTLWTGSTVFQLPDIKYFNPMDYLMTNIVVAEATLVPPKETWPGCQEGDVSSQVKITILELSHVH